jgi:dipeptidyl aminopeptidase/acylaminoacyl peptidase
MPNIFLRILLMAGLGMVLTAPGAADGMDKPRCMTVDDIMAIRNLSDVRLSPDGNWALYVVSVPNLERNIHDSDIYLISKKGGEPVRLTTGLGRDDHPRWSPDGSRIAFMSDRSGRPQVWTIVPSGGEAVQLTTLTSEAGTFKWSPDGRWLSLLLPDGGGEESGGRPECPQADIIRPGDDPARIHIHLVDVADGSIQRLTSGEYSVESLDWSPDGTRIVFSARPSSRIPDLFNSDLYLVDIAGGDTRALVARPGPDTTPRWSPDGRTIAFVSTNMRLEWIANWTICTIPTRGGAVRNLTADFDDFITSCTWSADSRRLLFQANQGLTVQLFAVDSESGEVERISDGFQVYSGFSFSGDTRLAAFSASDPSRPAEVFISNTSDFRPVRLTDTNPQLRDISLGEMEQISWNSGDGLRIEGILLKPAGYREGCRYPMLIYVHGGPSGKFGYSFSPQFGGGIPIQGETYPLQVLAGKGFAVFMPNPRGSSGYGEKFRMANVGDWGGGDFRDIMTGIDALIERGAADPDHLGIMGRSYGGYMTAWAITQTDRFKAASLGAGMCNLISFYGQTDIPGYMEYYFGGDIWEARELYLERSPLTHARRVATPTLITHGEKDTRVPLPQAWEYYHALKKTGIDLDFVIFPRQGHMIREPRLQRDMMCLNLSWFCERLLRE